MLDEGGGGDAGVHADHHVLGFFLPPAHTLSPGVDLQCDLNEIFSQGFNPVARKNNKLYR